MNELDQHPPSSSWGGSVVYAAEDGLYHMFFSEILGHCPMANWQTNSACFHSTSTSALGPFSNKTQLIAAFCHNAIVRQAQDASEPLFMMWHIGTGQQPSKVVQCNASGSEAAGSQQLASGSSGGYQNYFLYSRSVWGPWTDFGQNVLPGGSPGSWDESVVNMAPFPLPNGTVLLGYRGSDSKHIEKLGVAMASNWSGPYHSLSPDAPIVNASGEDPYLWVDGRGHIHMLFHSFATMGGHAFARQLAGPWTLSATPPFNSTVSWSNGTTVAYAERERPELLLHPVTGAPMVLYTAVLLRSASGTAWGPSFTAAAGIR